MLCLTRILSCRNSCTPTLHHVIKRLGHGWVISMRVGCRILKTCAAFPPTTCRQPQTSTLNPTCRPCTCLLLQLMTFGLDNNDPAWVLQQHLQLGVAAAIVGARSTPRPLLLPVDAVLLPSGHPAIGV